MGEKIRKMARVYNELSAELGREPSDQEVARKLGWDVGRVKNVKSAIPDATSLNRTLSSDEDSTQRLLRFGRNRRELPSRNRLDGCTE